MKSSTFVDTSGWLCYLDTTQPEHAQVNEFVQETVRQGGMLVTTSYIIVELVALMSSRTRFSRPQVIQTINTIKRMPFVSLIHIDPAVDADAWAMLEHYTDKDWSLVDASSFVLMGNLGITEAVTTDHHFAQAGFVRVP